MARVVFAEVADADMDFVVAELAAEGGTSVALKYQGKFKKLYDRLEAFPQSGAPRRRLGAGIRIGVVRPYVVIYRYTLANDTVTVLRVVHGRRRISRRIIPAAESG